MNTPVPPTYTIQDPEEKLAARKALTAPEGPMTKKMQNVERILGASTTEFFCGDQPTLADYSLFVFLSNFRTGYDIPVY